MDAPAQKLELLANNLTEVIRGKRERIEILIIAMLCEGSVLMEDIPGVGKTTLAKSLAKSIQLSFRRVQFTPDLLPGDILGSSVYDPRRGTFSFTEGPLFCNVLLADEINRASPRTQSALLEAMSERQATIEGRTYVLPTPFFILATQNPVEFQGTYPLPEAQLDRFLVSLQLGYPDPETELQIVYDRAGADPLDRLEPVLDRDELVQFQSDVKKVGVDTSVARYIVDIVDRTRRDSRLKLGASPRGLLMLFRAAQACALAAGRDFAIPDDVQRMAPYVLPHRLVRTSKARYGGVGRDEIIDDVVQQVRVPT